MKKVCFGTLLQLIYQARGSNVTYKSICGAVFAAYGCDDMEHRDSSLPGCAKTYHGTDELMEKARQEIPISDADTIEMQYAGMCGEDNKAIAWYISGDEYQAHYYLPMEIEIKGNGANYTFIHTYKPMTDRCADVAVVNWHQGYAFLINNPKVATVQITLQNGEITEEDIREIPYTFHIASVPSEYIFLDAEGNDIQ